MKIENEDCLTTPFLPSLPPSLPSSFSQFVTRILALIGSTGESALTRRVVRYLSNVVEEKILTLPPSLPSSFPAVRDTYFSADWQHGRERFDARSGALSL